MNEISCPLCGHQQAVAAPNHPAGSTTSCAACGMPLEIIVDGTQTIANPTSLTDGAETVLTGTGTVHLDPPRTESTPEVETVVQAALILRRAEPGDERLPLDGPVTTVGREFADITIDDPAMSASHFEIEIRGDEFFIRDLDSSNGTFLNNGRIRSAELTAGDSIRAGETTFGFMTFEAIRTGRSVPR